MEKNSVLKTSAAIMMITSLGGCGGRLVRENREPAFPAQAPSQEVSKAAPGAPEQATKATAPDEKSLAEARRNADIAHRNTEATAEYHFSLAQAYVAEGNPDRAIEEYKLTLVFDPNSPLVYARLATEYVKKGMLSAAMETCKEALQRDPKFTDARLLLAGLYSTSRETESALAEYDRVLKQEPGHEEAVIYKSQVLLEDGRSVEAVKTLRTFLKKNTESALGWYYLGRSEQRSEHFKEAVVAYKKAMELRAGFSQAALALGYLYEEQKMNAQAKAVYTELYEDTQDLSAANRLATLHLKEEKYKEAIPFLEAIAVSDPDDMNVRVKLGLVQMEMKQYEKAITTFKSILEKNPDSDRIHYYLGSLYEETKKTNEAIGELKQIKPDSKLYADAALHVAYLLKQSDRAGEARTFIHEAIAKSPRTPGFHLFEASLEEEAKNVDGAVKILEASIKYFPEDEKVRYYLGSLYERQGKTDASLEQMELILKTNPENVDALNYIGYTWTLKGIRLVDAEKLLKRALRLKPNNAYIQDSWGWHLFVRGRVKEAVVELEKAVRLKPTEPTILEHLGDVYVRVNLRQKAVEQYREAVRLSDDTELKKKIVEKLANLHYKMPGETERMPASGEKK